MTCASTMVYYMPHRSCRASTWCIFCMTIQTTGKTMNALTCCYSIMANTSISCSYSHFLCYSPLDINAINTPNYKMLFTFQFHWKTDQKIQNFNREEADEMAKNDPDFSIRDLYNSIADGKLPSWTL